MAASASGDDLHHPGLARGHILVLVWRVGVALPRGQHSSKARTILFPARHIVTDHLASFVLFFSIVTAWTLQIQCLLQIIINRLGLLLTNKKRFGIIKWGTAGLVLCINISVYAIWIPARLQVSPVFLHVNEIWDRCEKAIYLVVDGALNAYFLYLVKSKLLANGMTKYKGLFNFNSFIVFISLSMDVSRLPQFARARLFLALTMLRF
jgi:hypothetical protein